MALTGNLAETPFVDLIQFYCLKRETVAVRVKSARPGVPDGVFGERQGLEAVREALKLRDGAFRVDLNIKTPQRTIFEPWKKVLLEETWRQDEDGRQVANGHATPKKELIEEVSMNTSSSQPPLKGQ